MPTEQAPGVEGRLLDATTAAAVRVVGEDLPWVSRVASLRASMNEQLRSVLICCTLFSSNHFGQVLLKAESESAESPEQFGHFASLWHSLLW